MSKQNTIINLPEGIYFSTVPTVAGKIMGYVNPLINEISNRPNHNYDNAQHALLMYSDGKGDYRVIRGGHLIK